MPSQPAWRSGGAPAEDRGFRAWVRERLSALEIWVEDVHREISFGPVAGAYFPVTLGRSSTGAALPTGPVDLFTFGFEMRPVMVTLVCFGGDLTADIESEGATIFSAGPVALLDGVPQTFNARGDFTVEKVKVDLTLYVDAIDAGTPTHTRVTVISKNVSKVEPA